MITEDYVSFETAKLLNEKGFDSDECIAIYDMGNNGAFVRDSGIFDYGAEDYLEFMHGEEWKRFGYYLAPTLQMAMKWLREVHKIEIWVQYDIDKTTWWGGCNPMYEEDEENSNMFQNLLGFDYPGKTYEEACEAAIKYCLENLI